MMNYADYNFYKDIYKGSLSEALFNSFIVKASREIDKNVNRKMSDEDITDEVKFVACELCDFQNEKDKSSNVQSISIDGVSKTYKTKTSAEFLKQKEDILNGLPEDLTRYI